MDRPGSRTDIGRPTGLKQPGSRLPRALLETTPSEVNARQHDVMAPPATNGKHKMPGLPEPMSKQRKTLVERAGEVKRHDTMQSRQIKGSNGQLKRGTVPRSVISQIGRPASAQNGSYRTTTRQQYKADMRSDDEDEEYVLGRRKGTPRFSLSSTPRNVSVRKNRHTKSKIQHFDTPSTSVSYDHGQKEVEGIKCLGSERDLSLSAMMAELTITPCKRRTSPKDEKATTNETRDASSPEQNTADHDWSDATRRKASPSKLPLYKSNDCIQPLDDASLSSVARRKENLPIFLTKDHVTSVKLEHPLTTGTELDTRARLEAIDKQYLSMQSQFSAQVDESAAARTQLEEALAMWKARVEELQQVNHKLKVEQEMTCIDLDRARQDLQTTISDLHQSKLDHERSQADADKRHTQDLYEARLLHEKQIQGIERAGERAVGELENEVKEMKSSLEKEKSDELYKLRSDHWAEVEQLRQKHDHVLAEMRDDLTQMKKSDEGRSAESAQQVQALRDCIRTLECQITTSNNTSDALRAQIAAAETNAAALELEKNNLISKAHFLEGNQEAQSQEFTNMSKRLQEAEATAAYATEQLRKEETVRRRLNAQILELKGNIRVFARIRPVLEHEEQPTKVEYPDVDLLDGKKQMLVHAPTTFTATGKERNEKFDFTFDRVFNPDASNQDVFEDCRDLVQSVVDGYNVSILSYGQTGSGKTYGMSGVDGIIPSSIALLLAEIERLKSKDWAYRVEASFVEVYNDTLNDLLGDAKSWDMDDEIKTRSKARHEIHHDSLTGKTTVTNLSSTLLWPPPEGEDYERYTEDAIKRILETAMKNRRVAATKANERSSRSHSVFMLTLHGACSATNESSEGTLNLVDLAGSERLKHSGAEGARAKETAAINTSLKSLGDVIEKIGTGGHVPYRNSKLTYLLQSSLGGTTNGKSSRTLMLLHLSPLQAHWQETKTSLQFGVKVHGTHIGTAKKK